MRKQSSLSAVMPQTWACGGFINRKRRQWKGCITVTVKPAAVQDAVPQFLLIHLLPLCYNNSSHDITSNYTLAWECVKIVSIGCVIGCCVFKKYWFESHCWNFLQTPWLWNTKECWYNYPYQVKVFEVWTFHNFHKFSCGKMSCIDWKH